jgi:archaellum component FlaC
VVEKRSATDSLIEASMLQSQSIRDLRETIAQSNQQLSDRIDQLGERLGHKIDDLAVQLGSQSQSIGRLEKSINRLTENIDRVNSNLEQRLNQLIHSVDGHLRISEAQTANIGELTKLVANQAATVNRLLDRISA